MKNSSYAEKLLDPRWQKLRLKALETARWECTECFTDKVSLHVHHIKYVPGREPWEYDLSELSVLCKDCHAGKHGGPKRIGEPVTRRIPTVEEAEAETMKRLVREKEMRDKDKANWDRIQRRNRERITQEPVCQTGPTMSDLVRLQRLQRLYSTAKNHILGESHDPS